MRGFRAKDEDRDRFVELIEAAYVDGQLNSADRDLRVGRALSAETLDELQTLTRDLQPPPGAVTTTVPGVRAPGPRMPLLARLVGGFVAFSFVGVALVIGLIVVTMFVALGDGSTSSESGSGPVFESGLADPEVVSEDPPATPTFEMTPGQVRAFMRAYEEQFGTLEVYEAGFYPHRVGVQVPVRGSRPRMERWSWTGEWTQDTDASAVTGPTERVDLGTVDVRRMFANIETARKTLNVERGRLTHVLVNRWFDDQPSVNIYIGNQFNESGYLKTAPAGDVVRAFPYET
ncbi:DUF1707 domain-containing protein [Nocardioides KLBMP 9356]|uniref:DUF1707 domain-containing protein n=1 Tax=Nocardioides potassii TaxID=2911371 RepID=A0ABS9HI82_9ACTN|nr:DUF1707 domain-containing protein [Nocardioides potassii]MCF6379818.1 DUF1707 domain-containing protein [Nocardioides potassii]